MITALNITDSLAITQTLIFRKQQSLGIDFCEQNSKLSTPPSPLPSTSQNYFHSLPTSSKNFTQPFDFLLNTPLSLAVIASHFVYISFFISCLYLDCLSLSLQVFQDAILLKAEFFYLNPMDQETSSKSFKLTCICLYTYEHDSSVEHIQKSRHGFCFSVPVESIILVCSILQSEVNHSLSVCFTLYHHFAVRYTLHSFLFFCLPDRCTAC